MDKSISIWAFPGNWPLERSLRVASEAGFAGIELSYGLDGPITAETRPKEVAKIRAGLQRTGLQLVALASVVFWRFNLLSPDQEQRRAAMAHTRHMLRLASDLGTDAILMIPGFAGPFEAGPPVVADYEAAYCRAIADVQELALDAERSKVHIGLENVWNKFLTSPLEMRGFVDAVGSPYVGVYFDVGNVLRTGYPQHWIKVLGRRIRRVHVKDYRASVGSLQGFVGLLEGDVDYIAVLAALGEVGYDGWLTAEVSGSPQFPEALIHRTSRSMDCILRSLHHEQDCSHPM